MKLDLNMLIPQIGPMMWLILFFYFLFSYMISGLKLFYIK